jgi:hypothetical protein
LSAALLAKADSTEFPAEAEVARAKAKKVDRRAARVDDVYSQLKPPSTVEAWL